MPVSILIVVDLPAPLGPMYPTSSPASSDMLMPSTATRSTYVREKSVLSVPATPGVRSSALNTLRRSWVRMMGMRRPAFDGPHAQPASARTWIFPWTMRAS